jgi:hypothetical protein
MGALTQAASHWRVAGRGDREGAEGVLWLLGSVLIELALVGTSGIWFRQSAQRPDLRAAAYLVLITAELMPYLLLGDPGLIPADLLGDPWRERIILMGFAASALTIALYIVRHPNRKRRVL